MKSDMKNLVGYQIDQMVFSSPTAYKEKNLILLQSMFFFCVHINQLVINVFSCQ